MLWLRRYERISVQNQRYRSKRGGAVYPKFQVEVVPPPTILHFFFSENQAKCSFVWYKNLDRSFFRFVTIHAFVRQTDSWG